ncbi:DHH family phosphoesterase [Natranaeroarchaeum sulfidigenes]|uniref:Archaea-specific RecJ-like exonuclease, containsDnaJ-type Zn finger domain n=1 Tax=Natranaeroarchaeum sulfidigenes TaxID=2784880 RepID=A0A897MNB0_9EURY|nr:OB-fold nucleic acid binding domain-containing protein [Natranaeroarchaeum sulfidigenes]QSG02047.1 Archaea-specific RecJ-like exonuclease, containsDnaJ-type Zn finger domain [Natranaeroarchaeum sulfidigenes]
MSNCIICGKPVDGLVCSTHEEDVAFEFRGNSPEQLTPNRYYKGEVDGFAEFGVFVNIGDSVTGLLHRSELDQRLDSLDWDTGDDMYVKVKSIRDNGDVDLGWSIRQEDRDFRGRLIDAPSGDKKYDEDESGNADKSSATVDDDTAPDTTDETVAPNGGTTQGEQQTGDATTVVDEAVETLVDESADADDAESSLEDGESDEEEPDDDIEADEPEPDIDDEPADDVAAETIERSEIDTLGDRVGDRVRIEGEVVSVRQTSGPTIFELRDETGTVECAAFEEAGVRAYPEIETDDFVRLDGEVELRREELQVETAALMELTGGERAVVEERLRDALSEAARPEEIELLADHDAVAAVEDGIEAATTAIRRAIMIGRPIVVRHSATADGYAAGAALERAALPLIREEHDRQDAIYNYFNRRPLEGHIYDMEAATNDVTNMLEARERHGEQLPLVVLVDVGSTKESRDGYELLDVYDVERVVIDTHAPDEGVDSAVDTFVSAEDVTTPAIAANVAAAVNPDVRADLEHVPAVGYWEAAPEQYVELANEAGYDTEAVQELREAIALEAFYQTYRDKRELITDLLFERAEGLAGHVSEQFRTKLDTEIETAERNLTTREAKGVHFAVLDTDAYTHQYDFPTTTLLVDALHRRESEELGTPLVTLGVDDDEIHVRSSVGLDVREIADQAAERANNAAVSAVGGRDGHIEFLAGGRDDVLEAVIASIASEL